MSFTFSFSSFSSSFSSSSSSPFLPLPLFPFLPPLAPLPPHIPDLQVYSNPMKRWYDEAFKNIITWIQDGKIKCEETVTKGIENAPEAFIGLFRGDNVGKAVVFIE